VAFFHNRRTKCPRISDNKVYLSLSFSPFLFVAECNLCYSIPVRPLFRVLSIYMVALELAVAMMLLTRLYLQMRVQRILNCKFCPVT
jgi:hypothetical protein